MKCPVCGHPDQACEGDVKTRQQLIITSNGDMQRRNGRERVPVQRGRIGKAGYVGQSDGRVEVFDPQFPKIQFVQEADVEPPNKKRRARKKADDD